MTRLPVSALVIVVTAVAGVLAALAMPGRSDIIMGVTVGTAVAGVFAVLALMAFGRIRARGGQEQVTVMMRAFVGLMLARMIAYMALILASVVLEAGEPVSVCVGLVGGTIVFQAVEILHLRKMT